MKIGLKMLLAFCVLSGTASTVSAMQDYHKAIDDYDKARRSEQELADLRREHIQNQINKVVEIAFLKQELTHAKSKLGLMESQVVLQTAELTALKSELWNMAKAVEISRKRMRGAAGVSIAATGLFAGLVWHIQKN